MKEGIKKSGIGDPKDLEKGSVEWTRCYYDAWNRRDWEWIGAMLSSEIEWVNSARDERLTGMQAVIASFRSAIDGFPGAMIEVRAVHVAGSTIVAECAIKSGTNQDAARSAAFCEVFELKSGRCIRGTTYADAVRLLVDMSQTTSAAA